MSEKHNKSLEDLLIDDSFIRFIKDVASDEERQYWHSWQHQHPDHAILIKHAKELIRFAGSDERSVPDPHAELKRFEDSLKENSSHFREFGKRDIVRIRRRPKRFWSALSAALILVVISTGIFVSLESGADKIKDKEKTASLKSEYQTGFGEKAYLHLSDGSQIILNANSHLAYSWSNSTKNGQSIDVHLEGEAWFDIERSEGKTPRFFRVHTSEGIVEVVGTVFAVQTSSEGTRTVLEEGEVRIRIPESESTAHAQSVVLRPGEMAQLLPGSGHIKLEEVNPKIYTSWIRNLWTFDQTSLTEVAKRIETIFGVEVEIPSAELQEKTLSGTISSTNLQLIKEGLSEALQEKVRQNGDKVIIGTE